MIDLLFLFAIVVVGLLLLVIIFGLMWWRKNKIKKNPAWHLSLLSVYMPQQSTGDKQENNFLEEINRFEQLLSALSNIKEPIALETAVHNFGQEIYFYLAVPRLQVDFTIRQIQSLFPESQVDISGDYTIFADHGHQEAAYLEFEQPDILPLRTYKESEVDTFAPILGALSKLAETGEGLAIQIILNSPPAGIKKRIESVLKELRQGKSLQDISGGWKTFAKEAKKSFQNKGEDQLETKDIDDKAVEAINNKQSKTLFQANIRVVAASTDNYRVQDNLMSAVGAFTQLSSPVRNKLRAVKPSRLRKLINHYIFREFKEEQGILLNSEEVASLFHFPTVSTDIPFIKWFKTKEVAAPDDLPTSGLLLGENQFRGQKRPVYLADEDRRRHFYIIGQTGTGKSFFILNQAVQDINNGKGLCVIDPHGDVVSDILERVPSDRAEDVIVFDPGDVSRPLGMNMLEYNLERPEEKTFIVDEVQSILNRLYEKQPEGLGPVFQLFMRNALLLLMEDAKHEPGTLADIPRVFTDEEYRARKLARCANPSVVNFWEKEASQTTGDQSLANVSPYVTSKFGSFIANDYVRPIIGQAKSAFNFREVMDEGKILLVNLSKGRIGDLNASLLGMIITGKILQAALSRADADEKTRRDFYLYIDEFQNFTTDSISTILSEARKYKLNLILAHQYISQLTDGIRESVMGNVGSMAAFRVGPTDTETLLKHYGSTFTENDLLSVENRHAFIKMLINGEPAKPFNIKTATVQAGNDQLKNQLKELSRLTYGRDLQEVEEEIFKRMRQ
ncbi:MAG: type IV secretory system conjugative DNA transfer family protein [Patescibacteria group bacterium]